jgi:hypothetical protein
MIVYKQIAGRDTIFGDAHVGSLFPFVVWMGTPTANDT